MRAGTEVQMSLRLMKGRENGRMTFLDSSKIRRRHSPSRRLTSQVTLNSPSAKRKRRLISGRNFGRRPTATRSIRRPPLVLILGLAFETLKTPIPGHSGFVPKLTPLRDTSGATNVRTCDGRGGYSFPGSAFAALRTLIN